MRARRTVSFGYDFVTPPFGAKNFPLNGQKSLAFPHPPG